MIFEDSSFFIAIARDNDRWHKDALNPLDFIKGEERSILRNPLIAHTLYLSKEIERWGSGIRRIYEECEKHNVKEEFKKLKSRFVVVFFRMEKVGEKLVDRLADGLVERLVESQKKMLDLMRKDSNISKKELSLKLGISSTAIDKNIISLKKKGLLRRVGADRGGYWAVVGG